MDPVIQIENLSKRYRLGTIGGGTLRDDVSRWLASIRGRPDPTAKVGGKETARDITKREHWALRNVNLAVQKSELLGVIGSNGAGKSTLLKILSRITTPTSGRITIRGRVGSLLEVGTGFHMELTGRENVFLNGAILGMSRAEVSRKFDEIVEFAGMARFIDTPAKRYSSGMAVRLAFAVAAHLDPEILVVDEVLAVGDFEFQQKCIGKMQDAAGDGRTVLFVSHNLSTVSKLCTRCVWLDRGEVRETGQVDRVISAYEEITLSGLNDAGDTPYDLDASIGQVRVDSPGDGRESILPGDPVRIRISGVCRSPLPAVQVGCGLYAEDGRRLSLLESRCANAQFELAPGRFEIQCTISGVPLTEGRYSLNIALMQQHTLLDSRVRAVSFRVQNPESELASAAEFGPLRLHHSWQVLKSGGET